MRAAARRGPRTLLGLACAGLIGVGVAGCATAKGTSENAADVSGSTLSVVASLPPGATGGQAAQDVFDAELLAFLQSSGTVGEYHLRLLTVHADEVSQDARLAISHTNAIAYLGEILPGTSGVSTQITNEVGLLQVSPTDTAAYLTHATAGVAGSPQTFYPAHSTYGETFGRVVPTTLAEASALVARMQAEKLTSLRVGDDGSSYGVAVAGAVTAAARRAGITVTSGAGTADAVFYGGLPGAAARNALDAAAAAAPSAKLFAPSALYDDGFVSGLSAAAQRALTVSVPGIASGSLDPVGRAFQSAFTQRYGHAPAPQAIFGYEAMRAVLAALSEAGSHADSRTTVAQDFRDLHRSASQSALGAYALSGGDTNIAPFVFARVSGGALVPAPQS